MPSLSPQGNNNNNNNSNIPISAEHNGNSSGTNIPHTSNTTNSHDQSMRTGSNTPQQSHNISLSNESIYQSENDQQSKISSLPSYPLLDTFSLLCVLMIFPHWFSTICLILYVFMGNPDFLDSMLLFLLKHKINRSPATTTTTTTTTTTSSSNSKSTVLIVGDISLILFLSYLLLDAVFMCAIFFFIPGLVPYIILLSKSFIASNLTSLKNRYILDAFLSCTLLLLLENSMLYIIKHFEIFRGENILSLTSTLSSTDFLYPLYYTSTTSFTKTLLFYLTFHKIRENSSIMYQMEYALHFFHATLSMYIIIHSLNPVLRRFVFINRFYSYFESFVSDENLSDQQDFGNIPNDNFINNINNNRTTFQTVFQIPKEISGSTLPFLSFNKIFVDDSETETENENDNEQHNKNDELGQHNFNSSKIDDLSDDSTLNANSNDEKIPMWFPEDDQVINMNDVSSPGFVVAQNFENFCKMIWNSSAHLLSSHSTSSLLSQEMNSSSSSFSSSSTLPQSTSNQNVTTTNTTNTPTLSSLSSNGNISSSNIPSNITSSKFKNNRDYLMNNQQRRISSKSRNLLVSNDKKAKLNQLKYQQPLWLFLNAARTMFSRQDYYSGDYYSQNAIVTTGYGVDDYARNTNSSSQCFIWFTGETTLAFELHNISLEQLLIKVNGIIWEHVSSCAFFGREMVIINGLSPLSQYDIDFVKITLNGELIHLTTTTVSTVFQNKTVTESNISSPLATLQRSVVTTQEAIEREKARLKKMKADWRKRSSQLKSEIENLNNRSNFSDESRNYKKLDSLRQNVAKSDIEVATLSKKSEEVRLLQTEVEEKYLDAKRLYETEYRSFNKFENESKNSIMKQEKNIKSLLSEKNQLLMKKEKIISKKLRIHHDVELLTNELKTLKKTEIALRVERRKFRSIQREEKYKLLVNDIKKIEKQLRGRTMNTYQ
ncbi:hypothetical protein C6P40_001911 [Pichia californica]|uniref:Ubiquitination network signaling protein n=1 Tax=Pichia californica TaxID=460514 RepID=A0A9P6WQX2_9ASCO|nr:hypothetical protein C6P42_003195 [[Candida] californica]KAG0690688.1 hypothetical protein C6P40_001911 [[Candida] californica]